MTNAPKTKAQTTPGCLHIPVGDDRNKKWPRADTGRQLTVSWLQSGEPGAEVIFTRIFAGHRTRRVLAQAPGCHAASPPDSARRPLHSRPRDRQARPRAAACSPPCSGDPAKGAARPLPASWVRTAPPAPPRRAQPAEPGSGASSLSPPAHPGPRQPALSGPQQQDPGAPAPPAPGRGGAHRPARPPQQPLLPPSSSARCRHRQPLAATAPPAPAPAPWRRGREGARRSPAAPRREWGLEPSSCERTRSTTPCTRDCGPGNIFSRTRGFLETWATSGFSQKGTRTPLPFPCIPGQAGMVLSRAGHSRYVPGPSLQAGLERGIFASTRGRRQG